MSINGHPIAGWNASERVMQVAVLYWDSNTLAYVKGTQPVAGVGGAGDASAANQLLGNISLASIDTKTPALVSGSSPVKLAASDLSTLTPLTSVNVGNFPSSFSVSNFPATQAVSIASMPSTPVTGTFFQATQPISAAALPLPATAATDALQTAGNASLTTIAAKDIATSAKQDTANTALGLLATAAAQTTGNASLSTIASGIKSEDSVAADLDKGIANLAVRQDFPITDTSDVGDYSWIKTDAQGRLWVNSDSAGGLLQQDVDIQKSILAELRIHTLMLQMAFNIPDDMNSFRNDPNITVQ